MKREKIRPNLYLPDTWPDNVAKWRDQELLLDLSSFGPQRIPEALLTMLPDHDRHIGPVDFSHSILERCLWAELTFESEAAFDYAAFVAEVDLRGAQFTSRAGFNEARFRGPVYMSGASFQQSARFNKTVFKDIANFEDTTFARTPVFDDAQLREARFDNAVFEAGAKFNRTRFEAMASFTDCDFGGDLLFDGSVFGSEAHLDRSRFAGDVSFDRVIAEELSLTQTTFAGTNHEVLVTSSTEVPDGMIPDVGLWMLRSRIESDTVFVLGKECSLNAARLVVRAPVTIVAERPDRRGALTSVKEADITAPFRIGRHLDLSSTEWGDHDLTTITIADTKTLPQSKSLLGPHRRRLANDRRGASATEVAVLERNYRDLRRQLEATGNTHGANDFYYGEMEARRRQLTISDPRRWLLELYRMVSGYGTSPWRPIVTWQLLVLAAGRLLLIGGVDVGDKPLVHSKLQVWRFALDGSLSFFRPTAAPLLTIPETLIMVSLRILGPVLLALAAIAVRNQTKR